MSEMRPIPGTADRYLADTNGSIYAASFRRTGELRPMKQFENEFGYLCTQIRIDGRSCTHLAHRLVANTFIPNPEELPQINHKDGNKKNNRVENLEWITASGNIRHSLAIGLKPILRGEEHGMAILTEAQVREIRRTPIIRKYGHAQILARKYGVRPGLISQVLAGTNWRWVV